MTHQLTLGSLLLTDSLPHEDHGYVFNVLADGVSRGVAKGVQEVVRSLLADGDLVRITRYGNREVSFDVQVTGPSLASLSEAEAALRRELGIGNALTWEAPDYLAAATVFDVVTSEMEERFNDLDELRNTRTFTVTLTCAPFARSADLTTVAALDIPPVTPTTATITNADTTAGFTASKTVTSFGSGGTAVTQFPVTVTDEGSYVRAAASDSYVSVSISYATSAVSMASTKYLSVEMSGSAPSTFTLTVGGVTKVYAPVLTRANTGGTTLYVFDTAGGSFTGFAASTPTIGGAGTVGINVHDISRTDTLPQVSPRQSTRVIEVGGTERAPASLHAYTSSGFLGNTILHTTPFDASGYTPDLSRWRHTGNTPVANVSSRKITGTWEPLQPNPLVARLLSSQLPRGDYILMAAIKSSLTGERAISWAVKSLLVSSVVGNVTGTAYYNFPVADRLEYVPLGVLSAPVVRSEGFLETEVHLSNPSPGSVTLHAEEAWLFADGPDSALSIIGTDEAELWLETADMSSSVPRVWVGNSNGRFHPNSRLMAHGDHRFSPGLVQVTSISDANDYLEVDLSYHEHWHSNAAR